MTGTYEYDGRSSETLKTESIYHLDALLSLFLASLVKDDITSPQLSRQKKRKWRDIHHQPKNFGNSQRDLFLQLKGISSTLLLLTHPSNFEKEVEIMRRGDAYLSLGKWMKKGVFPSSSIHQP